MWHSARERIIFDYLKLYLSLCFIKKKEMALALEEQL